jgi:type II secretory pathway predicted ATPase ExeA
MWLAYWGLNRDPFGDGDPLYVALPGHEEAVARLHHLVVSGQRWGILSGRPGMGKTRVLRRALAEVRGPSRRIALASGAWDASAIYARLAEGLGSRAVASPDLGGAWRALEHSIRLCVVQNLQVVLAVDDCQVVLAGETGKDLLRLRSLGESQAGCVTILIVVGDGSTEPPDAFVEWSLAVRLGPISRSDAGRYLAERLAGAGCHDVLFSPRAITRLHLLSQGTPRGLDRLASLCLMAGASRGQEAISSELVESVLGECLLPPELAFRS